MYLFNALNIFDFYAFFFNIEGKLLTLNVIMLKIYSITFCCLYCRFIFLYMLFETKYFNVANIKYTFYYSYANMPHEKLQKHYLKFNQEIIKYDICLPSQSSLK